MYFKREVGYFFYLKIVILGRPLHTILMRGEKMKKKKREVVIPKQEAKIIYQKPTTCIVFDGKLREVKL